MGGNVGGGRAGGLGGGVCGCGGGAIGGHGGFRGGSAPYEWTIEGGDEYARTPPVAPDVTLPPALGVLPEAVPVLGSVANGS